MTRQWWTEILALVAMGGGFGGCTLALDWDECSASEPCPVGSSCEGGACVLDEDAPGKPRVDVTQAIGSDTTWTADNDYVLKGVVYVAPNATLTIRSGVTILGEQGSALVVRAGGRLEARGTLSEPVVFTSAKPAGQRAAGDWGGVVLLGRASVNEDAPKFEAIEDSALSGYGGDADAHRCGVVQYTRIEFTGFAAFANTRYNGLTLAGCGTDTLVDHVQVHKSAGDGVQVLGGTVALSHVMLTDIAEDALGWAFGWRGSAQFLMVQQGEGDETAIESSNNPKNFVALPRSEPQIYNYTLIGSGSDGGNQRAIYLQAGGGGHFANGLVMGQSLEALDVIDAVTAGLFVTDNLGITNTLFFDIGPAGTHYFPLADEEKGEENDDGSFDEDSWFKKNDYENVFGLDPQLAGPFGRDPTGWVPTSGNLAGMSRRPPVGLDQAGDYLGAFQPGVAPWTTDWTSFPQN